MQLDYSNTPDVGFAGMAVDNGPKDIVTGLNEESVDAAVGFGVGVVEGEDSDQGFLLPSEDGQELKGITVHEHRGDNSQIAGAGAIPSGGVAPIGRKGRWFVQVEDAVTKGEKAYCRFAANGDSTQLGKFRSDNDGVQQVTTVTPSSANSTRFGLIITCRKSGRTFRFEYTSDSSSSATEICDGLRTAMALNTDFTDLITPSGTATLILTAVDKGEDFDVVADGSAGTYSSITTGTPASKRAFETPFRFRSSTEGAGLAALEVNLP